MDTRQVCSICEYPDITEVFTFKNYPAYIVPLNPELAPDVVRGNLSLYVCSVCGHMQTINPDPEIQRLIYEVYYSYYVVDSSEAFVPHYRIPFNSFIENLSADGLLPKGNLLEIGCSSGEKADYFSSFSKQYTGIDPSTRIKTAMTNHPGHRFIQGYFPQDIPAGELFDVIVTQFNLEHIQHVNSFIQHIYETISPDGVLLIQVPDCGYFLKTSQPNFLAHEHLQYFTKSTLTVLLEKNGFKPIEWGEEGPSLITAAVKTNQPFGIDATIAETSVKNALAQVQLLKSPPDIPSSPVLFYGVGPQLYWLLNFYKGDLAKIAVADDNPNYLHQGLPGYALKIDKISADLIREMKTVILSLNKIYHLQVINRIKSLNVPCSIIYLDGNQWTVLNI
jgi:2-polyprenyl-3-methyl-5-hydroxy-6-metoxy-1,4-benzoquinol methylase